MANDTEINVSDMNQMLSTTEASSILRVHPNTLRRWSDQGIVKSYRVGPRGDRRFMLYDIAAFLASGFNTSNYAFDRIGNL